MPSSAGPNTAGESNLVFAYDLGDVVNSYKGEPTTNFAYLHNGRKDSSYESYMPESGTGQIAALHPGAIRVYNQAGSDISYYLNTGINTSNSGVEWYDTNHAYWVYDEVLKKPVVQMIDKTGVWQAKYMGLGVTWADLGLTNGDQYTMSWLQWSSDGVKRAHAGVYWYDTTAGSNNFWDGLSDTGNSTPGVWTRVSQTFTLSAGKSLNQGLTWYMYGMYFSRAILKIADVQLEKKSHATTFTFTNTRSVTQGLLPLVGSTSIDLTNMSFDSSAQMVFDGTNDNITLDASIGNLGTADWSISCWWKSNGTQAAYTSIISQGFIYPISSGGWAFKVKNSSGQNTLSFSYATSGETVTDVVTSAACNDGNWHNLVAVRNGGTVILYMDGVSVGSFTPGASYSFGTGATTYVGYTPRDAAYINGYLNTLTKYNRALAPSEVQTNYTVLRKRFNV
jgi:hypothetical protein